MIYRLLAAFAVFALPISAQTTKPNIIFILCDDLGYGDVGTFFQNQRAKAGDRSEPWHLTPQLDKMAEEGMRLPQHYCPAPVCAPSRASLLTGRHQGQATIRDNQFDKELVDKLTLASMLKEADYATAAIGKWGLQGKGDSPETWPSYPTKCGFDYFCGYVRHRDGHEHYPKEGPVRGQKEVWLNDKNISDGLDKCYTTDLFIAQAKKWIVDQHAKPKEHPFFMYLAFDTPHAATQVPPTAYPEGGGLKGGIQWTGKPGEMINTAKGKINSYIHPDYADATWDDDKDPTTPEVAWPDVYKKYATMVQRIDRGVGDILQTLDELGAGENTLVIFTTDNGPSNESYIKQPFKADFFESFGPHDGIKRDCMEGGLRVGALTRWPKGIKAGQTSDLPSQFHDWMPTFAELAGLPVPALADGASLAPSLTGEGKQLPTLVYTEYNVGGKTPNYPEFGPNQGRVRKQMQMIRSEHMVGLRYDIKSHDTPFEIYDIIKDPRQRTNLAKSMPGLENRMRDFVLRIRKPEPSAPRPYDDEAVPNVVPDKRSASKPGVLWNAYAGEFPWVPEMTNMDPTWNGKNESISFPVVTKKAESLATLYSGYIKIPETGEYTFYLPSDVKAIMRLHEIAVIEPAADDKGASTKLKLEAGLHPFRLYVLDPNDKEFSLEWSSDKIEKQVVPSEALRH